MGIEHDHASPCPEDVELVDLTEEATKHRIATLVAACEVRDGHSPFGDHELLAIARGTTEGHLGFGVDDHGGELVGYGHLSTLGGTWFTEVAVHPDHRGCGIGTRVMDAILAHVAVHNGGPLMTWSYRMDSATEGLVRHAGFRPVRTLFQMRLNDLPASEPSLPDGLIRDTFDIDRDEAEWLAVNAQAFADVPDQGSWTRRDLATRLSAPWFRAQDFLLFRRDGKIVAFCWCKMDPAARSHEGKQFGEIYVVGMVSDESGRGLGPIVATIGLAHLKQRGAEVGMLYVDSANERAVAMYEGIGFVRNHEDICLQVDVPAQP